VNYDLERIWKEVVVAYFDVLPWHLPGGTEVNHKKKTSVRISGLQAENRTWDLTNTKQECLTTRPRCPVSELRIIGKRNFSDLSNPKSLSRLVK
jgi:hypothetical protein